MHVLIVQKVLSGSDHAGRLRLMGKYIGHRLVARPELDNTFWTDSTSTYRELLTPVGRERLLVLQQDAEVRLPDREAGGGGGDRGRGRGRGRRGAVGMQPL